MTAGWVAAVPPALATVLAGWFAFLARRAQSHGPESVAGGYSQLVGDMRRQQAEINERVATLEAERAERDRKIEMLTRQVAWLLERVPAEQRVQFRERFPSDR